MTGVTMNARAFVIGGCLIVAACSTPLAPDPTGTGGSGGIWVEPPRGGTGGFAGTGGLPSIVGDAGAIGSAGTGGLPSIVGDAGAIGSAGTGGSAGAAGSAGPGGTGGIAACVSSGLSAGIILTGDEPGATSRATFKVPVTVVSSDDCASGICGSSRTGARRIVLAEAGGKRWTMDAYYTGLPADIVDVGEVLDLQQVFRSLPTGVGSYDIWSTLLVRGSTAVIFSVADASDLPPYGITVVSNGTGTCMRGTCYASYGADVTYGAETRSVAPGQAVNIGKLWFLHGGFDRWATRLCGDSIMSKQSMAGFTAR